MPKEMMPGHYMLPPFKYPDGEYERIFGRSGNRIEVHCNECPERKLCGGIISRPIADGKYCNAHMREAGNG